MSDERSDAMPDPFDRLLGSLHGLPDVSSTKATTIRTVTPLVGTSQAWIIQTYRQTESGDTVFLETMQRGQVVRLAIPPAVADTIARQRDALTTKARRRAARAAAQTRKERGIVPAFGRRKEHRP